MSLILRRIELSNIRSHSYTVFEPLATGITSISGPTGSGKSTIVDSIAWNIYGTKPPDVAKVSSLIKEGTDLNKQKSYVDLELEYDNIFLKIERKIVTKTGSVECNVWEKKDVNQDWVHMSGPAVSHTDKYIKNRLKMDEKGFLAAVFVQQKQVDQLISAAPKERGAVIEKLTGISSISAALTEARQNYNTVKKTLQLTEYNTDEKEELVKSKDKITKELNEKNKKNETYENKISNLRIKIKDLTNKIKDIDNVENRKNSLNNDKIKCETFISSCESEINNLIKLKNTKKGQLPNNLSASINLEETNENLRNIRTKLKNNNSSISLLTVEQDKLKSSLGEYKEIIDKSKVKNLDTAIVSRDKFVSKIDTNIITINKLENSKQQILANIKNIDNAINVIKDGNGSCPTCLQEVHNPDEAINKLLNDKKNFEDEIASIDNSLVEENKLEDNNKEILDKFNILIEALENFEDFSKRLVDCESSIKEKSDLVISLEADEKSLNGLLNKLENYQNVKNEYDALLNQLNKKSDLKEKAQQKLSKVDNELNSIKKINGSDNVSVLRDNLDSLQNDLSVLLEDFNEVKRDIAVLNEQLKNIDEKIDKSDELYNRYQTILKNVEIASSSVNMIDEFKRDRIKNSIPVVSSFASDLINRFTDGYFTQLKLDEKFNVQVVVNNGVSRPAGVLSGGEYSLAALALRLAISLLLNSGNTNNMIVLDEVFVSLDNDRANAVISTIADVCKGQVIIISHGLAVNDIADKVINL